MSQSPDTSAFAQARDELNRKIAAVPNDGIRECLFDERPLLETLYKTSIHEGCSHEKRNKSAVRFANAVIGDGDNQARVKIFATVLSLTTGPTAEIWTRFISALALESPNDRHRDFLDDCIPKFDLKYIESQLGERFASDFAEKLCHFSPPDSDCKFDEKLGDLRELVEEARHCYKTETWTYGHNEDGEPIKETSTETEGTGHCWSELAALKIVEHSKELLRTFYLEHIKRSSQYTEASQIMRRHKLQQAREESDEFLGGVQTRVRILATLLSIKVPWEAKIWNVFIEACMSGSAGSHMLDEDLPYTPDNIDRIFKHSFDRAVRDSFHDRQFWFCLHKIRRPSSERSESRIPVRLAHMPFLRKQRCGEGASKSAVFYVDIVPGHIQNINSGKWDPEPTRLAMKQISFDNNANQEVKVNMLIDAQAFKHKNIVEIRGIHWLEDAVLIFMEPADCNLYEFMTVHCRCPAARPEVRKARLQNFTKIANALVHLHSNLEQDSKKIHFMHKDLKAENILVMRDRDVICDLKLTDFGLSSIKVESSSQSDRGSRPIDRSSRTRLPTTAVHFAPEAWKHKTVTKKSDVWAFGIGLAEFVAWIAKGSEGLKGLEGKLRDAATHNFWTIDKGEQVLSPVVTTWFESLIAEPGLSEDERLMYKSCWLLLKHVCLVCDPEYRGKMEQVHELLQGICTGSKKVEKTILSEFPERANDETVHTDNGEDGLRRSSTTTTNTTQRSTPLSTPGATQAVSSGNRSTTTRSSAESSTSPPRDADRISQNKSSNRKWYSIRGSSKIGSNSNKNGAASPLPHAPPSDLRGTMSIPKSPPGASVGAEEHPSRLTDQRPKNLQEAAFRGDTDSIHQLLDTEQGQIDLNTKDSKGMTPLLHALKQRNVQAAILLIEKEADVTIIPNGERSALHYAVMIPPGEDPDRDLPVLLLRRSPGLIKKRNQGGDTALHRLAYFADKDTLGRLEKMVEVLKMTDIAALDEALRSRNGKMKMPCDSLRGDMLPSGDREKLIKLLRPLGREPESSVAMFRA